MTLKEFDKVRPYLPENTQIEISLPDADQDKPAIGQGWAIELADWGNHDGRFNIHCQACDWYSNDIPRHLRAETSIAYLRKPCPKCGAKFYNIGKENKK